jgi:hypothetical protein
MKHGGWVLGNCDIDFLPKFAISEIRKSQNKTEILPKSFENTESKSDKLQN